jgi:hypothetical protein
MRMLDETPLRVDAPTNTAGELADDTKGRSVHSVLRETFRLPRSEARRRAQQLFQIFPSADYMTEIESCRELPGGMVELTVRWQEDSPNPEDDTPLVD